MCIYIKKNIRCGSAAVDVEVAQVEIPVDQAAQAVHEEELDEGVALSTPPPEVS